MKKVERYINEIIKGKGEYSTTYHYSENSKKYAWTIYGSAINHILCDFEAKLLEDMIFVLKENGLNPCVRMFDGCMVDGDYYENTEIVSKIETYINDKWKNLNISVATKPHVYVFIYFLGLYEMIVGSRRR